MKKFNKPLISKKNSEKIKTIRKNIRAPKAWSNVSSANLSKSVEYDLIEGAIGESLTPELIGFIRIMRGLPTVDGDGR